MKIDHYIFFPEVVARQPGSVTIRVDALDDYAPEDFNIYLAIALLRAAEIVGFEQLYDYESIKNDYLYNKTIALPDIAYRGPLADQYTTLQVEAGKIMDDPDYRTNLLSTFNHVHFGDDMPEELPDDTEQRNAHHEIMMQIGKISEQIEDELGIMTKTTGWPRLPNWQFDYSLPATLILSPYKYDEALLPQLQAEANKLVKSFTVKEDTDEYGEKYWLVGIMH